MNALAELDKGNRAAEDEEMDATIDLLKNEVNSGFREVNARIDALRVETNARIDVLRRESYEQATQLRIETYDRLDQSRKEMQESFRVLDAKLELFRTDTRKNFDVVYRWLA
ncbi:hypothetical protein [Duganella sp. BuS-21]|uniref:hypothetical protein n=1 Tax=Duganella sp. BuS-21 TaxID=2943848 RepID=UPI0035A5D024